MFSKVLIAAAALIAGAPPSASGTPRPEVLRTGSVYDAPNAEDKQDTVQAEFSTASRPDSIEFVLTTPSGVTWWKGIRLVDRASGQVLGSEFTQDAKHTSGVLTLTADQAMRGASIVFSKAKTFGVHNDMYSASVPSDQKGRRVTIHWLKD